MGRADAENEQESFCDFPLPPPEAKPQRVGDMETLLEMPQIPPETVRLEDLAHFIPNRLYLRHFKVTFC